jgi:predicted nucleotidyltransferase
LHTKTLDELRTQNKDAILALARRYGVRNVRVFGSVARGDDRQDSDIDFLISLEQGRDLMDWSGFWIDLKDMLQRDVDVVEESSLHWFLREPILSEAVKL